MIPGLPKDILCYLFGVSPMLFWVFAVVSILGRMPGTWAVSAHGAKVAAGEYVDLILLTAIVVAVALPLYLLPGPDRGVAPGARVNPRRAT